MKIGIDLDNTINCSDKTANFFSMFTKSMKESGAIIYIITRREQSKKSYEETIDELNRLNIYFNHLEITDKKSEFILKNNIDIFYDDTDEYFLDLPENVIVFKIREDGNFDFKEKKWVVSEKTARFL